jgi:hypothetical protein
LGAAQVPRGVVGQACKVSSPQIADLWIILCHDVNLFGTWVVDDAKDPKKRSRSSPGGNKHRRIAGNRLAGAVRLSPMERCKLALDLPASTMQPQPRLGRRRARNDKTTLSHVLVQLDD